MFLCLFESFRRELNRSKEDSEDYLACHFVNLRLEFFIVVNYYMPYILS